MINNRNYEKKLFVENYNVTSPHYKGSSKVFLVIGDLHIHCHVDIKICETLIKKISCIQPDYVLIPGDIIETMDIIENSKGRLLLEGFIKSIGQICPVIIIPGNHDIVDLSSLKKRLQIKNDAEQARKLMKYFESWNRFPNVFFLNNKQITIDDICFIGFNPSIATYLKKNDQRTNEEFVENFYESGLKIDSNHFNVFLTHSPMLLFNDFVKSKVVDLKNVDLIVTAHFHNGYLPKCLDKQFQNTNVGVFITPFLSPYPGLPCRGIHKYSRGALLISKGFRKYTNDNFLFNFLEKFTANDIETITVENGPECVAKKISD